MAGGPESRAASNAASWWPSSWGMATLRHGKKTLTGARPSRRSTAQTMLTRPCTTHGPAAPCSRPQPKEARRSSQWMS
eukprot:7028493-Alexandrium_andersonii.AAC.1